MSDEEYGRLWAAQNGQPPPDPRGYINREAINAMTPEQAAEFYDGFHQTFTGRVPAPDQPADPDTPHVVPGREG